MYGILVIGAPGSGKSTFVAGLSDIFRQLKRPMCAVNLDPANDYVPYEHDVDIKELITVSEVMDRLELGPNGALKYCIETLCENRDWLLQKMLANKDKYVVIDCPGQVELYKSEGELWKVIRHLEKSGIRLCALHLSDSLYCSDAAKFISVALSTLATMVTMEMPQVNVLSKMDLFSDTGIFDLEFFRWMPDPSKLVEFLNDVPGLEQYKKLNAEICDVISRYDLLSFVPLNVQDKASMLQVIGLVDKANGFALTEQGDLRDLVFEIEANEENIPGLEDYKLRNSISYNGPKYQMSFGTVKAENSKIPSLQIPINGGQLKVPKAFYHYSETDLGTDASFKVPENGGLWDTNALVKNNRKDIHGVYLPLPNFEPINLHFITQRTFEKGIASQAHEDTPEFALTKAKQICIRKSEAECEKALLRYHRLKSAEISKQRQPIVDQLIDLADVASSARFVDREGQSGGVVVGLPGYDPIYIGGGLNNNQRNRLSFQFSPP